MNSNKIINTLFMVALFGIAGPKLQARKTEWCSKKLEKKISKPDYIDPDFAPITIKNNTVISGNKKITLSKSGLPQSSSYGKWEIFKYPVSLIFEDDRAVVRLRHRSFKLEKSEKNAAIVRSVLEGAGVRFEICGKFNFDLTIAYTIKLTTINSKVEIRKLALFFPLNLKHDQEKQVCYYKGVDNEPSSGSKEQKSSVHLIIRGQDYKQIAPGFCSNFWAGTNNYGLLWNCDSPKAWNPVKGSELNFDPGSGTLSVNFIQRKTKLEGSVTYKFFITPTPVKDVIN